MLLDRVLLTLILLLGLAQVALADVGAAPVGPSATVLAEASRAPPGAIAYLPGGPVTALAVRDDGELAAVALADGEVRVFRAGSGVQVARTRLPGAAHRLRFLRSGDLLAAGPDRVQRIDPLRGEVRGGVVPAGEPARDTAVDEVGGRLLRAQRDGLRALDLADLEAEPVRLEDGAGDLALAVSAGGDWVAAGGRGRVARIRAAGSGQVVEVFEDLRGWVLALEFLPDDRTLVVAGDAARVWLYDAIAGEPVGHVQGHRGWISTLAVSPDGRWLATAGSDETVRLYDLTRLRLRRRLEGHFEEVRALAFTPDGTMLLSGGDDRQLMVWDLVAAGLVSPGS